MNNSRRRRNTVLVAVAVLCLVGYLVYLYVTSFQMLTIKVNESTPGSTISVYANKSEERVLVTENPQENEPLRLKRGHYTVELRGDDYNTLSFGVSLGETPETVEIYPEFTDRKLRELLRQEETAITRQIHQTIPETRNTYAISGGKLYLMGQWYGAKIHVKQTAEQARLGYVDTFRVILHKDTGSWKVVTNPPELVLSHVSYPSIPRNILVDINTNPSSGLTPGG